MIKLSLEKEKCARPYEMGDRYTLVVQVTERVVASRFIDELSLRQLPEDYVVNLLVDDMAKTLRSQIKEQLLTAMQAPVKQVWSN